MRSWDACANPDLDIESFVGQPCWIGLDLASKTDIAALVLVFQHPEITLEIKRSVKLMDSGNFFWKTLRPPGCSFFRRRQCQRYFLQTKTKKISVDSTECASKVLRLPCIKLLSVCCVFGQSSNSQICNG